MKADGRASEDFRNWQVHVHGLLEDISPSLDTSAFRILKEVLLQVLREMLGTRRVDEDAQYERCIRDGE